MVTEPPSNHETKKTTMTNTDPRSGNSAVHKTIEQLEREARENMKALRATQFHGACFRFCVALIIAALALAFLL